MNKVSKCFVFLKILKNIPLNDGIDLAKFRRKLIYRNIFLIYNSGMGEIPRL